MVRVAAVGVDVNGEQSKWQVRIVSQWACKTQYNRAENDVKFLDWRLRWAGGDIVPERQFDKRGLTFWCVFLLLNIVVRETKCQSTVTYLLNKVSQLLSVSHFDSTKNV